MRKKCLIRNLIPQVRLGIDIVVCKTQEYQIRNFNNDNIKYIQSKCREGIIILIFDFINCFGNLPEHRITVKMASIIDVTAKRKV